jgi:hypothetical protein
MKRSKRTYLILFSAVLLALVVRTVFFIPDEAPRTVLNLYRTVKSVQTLNIAEHAYAAQHLEAGFACKLSDLGGQGAESELEVGFVDPVLASGTKAGYEFEIACSIPREDRKVSSYTVSALQTTKSREGFAKAAQSLRLSLVT